MPRAYRNGPEGDAGLSKEGRRCSQEEQRRLCFSSPQRGPVRHKEHSQSFNRTSKSFLCALRVSAVKNVVSQCARLPYSSRAHPRRRRPSAVIFAAPPKPTRKCFGISKKCPGTTLVSYFSCSRLQNSSTFPFRNFGKTTVPQEGRKQRRSRRESRNAFTARWLVSRSCRARAATCSSLSRASTLSSSPGCTGVAAKTSLMCHMRSASSGSASTQPHRKPLSP